MTDEQAIAAYTALYLEYPVLWEAACQAAIDNGAAKPRGASERAQAGMLAYQNRGYFWQTPLAQSRFARPRRSRPGSGPRRVRAGHGGKRLHARLAGRLRQVPARQWLAGRARLRASL